MISEAQSEQASLYVLGVLPADEARSFEIELADNPELSAEVASLNNATLALAHSAPKLPVPDECKERVMTSVGKAVTIPFQKPRPRLFSIVPWAAAACLAAISAWQLKQQQNSDELLNLQAQQTSSTEAKLAALQTSTAAQAQELTGKVIAAETSRSQWEAKFNEVNQKLVTAEADRQTLVARMTALEQKDTIAQAKVSVMGSTNKKIPKALAVSVWDQDKQNGVLVVENLPVLARGRTYQLWIIDTNAQAPISAGLFTVDDAGTNRTKITPDQAIQKPAKFAVTEEKEGGVAAPTMANMIVIGG